MAASHKQLKAKNWYTRDKGWDKGGQKGQWPPTTYTYHHNS